MQKLKRTCILSLTVFNSAATSKYKKVHLREHRAVADGKHVHTSLQTEWSCDLTQTLDVVYFIQTNVSYNIKHTF